MYAETGFLFPYLQNFAHEAQQLEDFCNSHSTSPSLTSTISEYDLGGEGDLFKAPEPILEEPLGSLVSMISCGEDGISNMTSDIESFQNEQLLSEVFYECKKDLLEKAARDSPFTEVLDMKFNVEDNLLPCSQFPKSVSSGCLSSMEMLPSASAGTGFVDFQGMEFGSLYGMRRAYSDGDIKTLGNGNRSITANRSSSMERHLSNCSSEERKEKLSRYWNKKAKRNFGRKIKYACRKALADSQPRIRGRFAKTEESDTHKRQ